MPGTPAPDNQDGRSEETLLRRLAEMIETAYTAQHLTLTDPKTLTAFEIAMDVAKTITAGARAQGIVDDAQQAQLAGLLEGAVRAARLGDGP